MADVNIVELGSTVVTDTTVSEVINVIGLTHFILNPRVHRLFGRIATAGGSVIAFDQLDIQVMVSKGGTWKTIISDFTAGAGGFKLFNVPSSLQTLAHGADGLFILNTSGAHAIRFRSAQAGVTASPVTRTLEVAVQRLY